MSLIQVIRQNPQLYNDNEISLNFLSRITDTVKVLNRTRKHGIRPTKASLNTSRRLHRQHHRKKIIVIPVENLNQVQRWQMYSYDVPNGIPAYQKVYDPRLPSEFFTSWYFAQYYLLRISKIPYDEICSMMLELRGDSGFNDVREFLSDI